MRVQTDDYDLTFERAEREGLVKVVGSSESVETFRQTVELAGVTEGLQARREDEELLGDLGDETGPQRAVYASEGTVSMFLSFEVLNYL